MKAQTPEGRVIWRRNALFRDKGVVEFQCVHCRQHVTSTWLLSGVRNRNHCPYCLHSRHLDLFHAGDRLAACKGRMQPVGLTLKRTPKKYGDGWGELMLVHRCVECGKLSINRIAADDDNTSLLALLDQPNLAELNVAEIRPLTIVDTARVRKQLFGKN
jgi:DNA-directed RNA polymerase subunit RPC12/RpoP